jgi:hypothetical protein
VAHALTFTSATCVVNWEENWVDREGYKYGAVQKCTDTWSQ